MSNEQVEKAADHRSAAERLIEPNIPDDFGGRSQPYPFDPATAQVHATLYVGEQLERLNSRLEDVVSFTGSGGFLKVRNG